MKELKPIQISMGGHFDSDYEIGRVVQTELGNRYFLNLLFSVLHRQNGRGGLAEELKKKAQAVVLDMQGRGLSHPFYSPDGLQELVKKD